MYGPYAGPVTSAAYTTIVADPTIAAAVTSGRLRTFFGPPVSDRASPIELYVGSDGLPDSEAEITASLSWATSGGGDVAEIDEIIDIPCAVWAKDGGAVNLPALHTEAAAIAAAAVQAIRGAVNLGLAPVMWSMVPGYSIRLVQSTTGADVFIPFTIQVHTRV
jgi:hypothetical protein